MIRFALAACVISLFVAAVARCEGGAPEVDSNFTISKQRTADEIVVHKEQGVTVFVVSSSNGIGWAKFRTEKAWPMRAILRLTYAGGREWKHLEGVSISNRRAYIGTSLQGSLEVRPSNEEGRRELDGLSERELADRIGVEVRKNGPAIDVLLPMNWLAADDEFTVRWIDLYRN